MNKKISVILFNLKIILMIFLGSVGFIGFIFNNMNETDKLKLYNLVETVMEKQKSEEKKEYKTTGRPLTEKELKEWKKSFTDIEESIAGLKEKK